MNISPILALSSQTQGESEITPPESLEIACEGIKAPLRYKLASVLSCDGHVTAHVRDRGEWVFFDDDVAVQRSPEQSAASKAWTTMIFYQLENNVAV